MGARQKGKCCIYFQLLDKLGYGHIEEFICIAKRSCKMVVLLWNLSVRHVCLLAMSCKAGILC
jgi:hypothetical protein